MKILIKMTFKPILLLSFVFFFYSGYSQNFFTIQELKSLRMSGNMDDIKKLAVSKGYIEKIKAEEGMLLYMDKYESGISYTTGTGTINCIARHPPQVTISKYIKDLGTYFIQSPDNLGEWTSKDKKIFLELKLSPDKKDLIFTLYSLDKTDEAKSETDTDNSEKESDRVYAKKISENKFTIDSYTNSTDVKIKKGEKIIISATGTITYGAWAGSGGPNGIDGYTSYNRIQGLRHGSLLVRIGDSGDWEAVGTLKSIVANDSGVLQFLVNDGDPSNNSGSFTVNIKITK